MSSMEQLSKMINAALESRVTNITQLANEAGCSRQAIYNYLQGKNQPTMELAEALANTLGLTLVLVPLKKDKKLSA